ncbi:MAG: DnaD domain protein [Defluviitaleaceae bacterium]|nr:DnaD domain protein [Defluviitaleaceae bacterium]
MNDITLSKNFTKELPTTHPMYSVLYIQGFSCAVNNISNVSVAQTAKMFNILESDVVNAWQFWQAKNFVQLTFNSPKEIFVEFTQEKPLTNPTPSSSVQKLENNTQKPKRNLLYEKPVYSPQELEIYKTNHNHIEFIFTLAEKAMGRLLKDGELSTIYSFYDWLRLPIEVIEILLDYCVQNNQRNIKYMETVALDWSEKKIDTVQKAQAHIADYDNKYWQVLKALGQTGRNLTPKEQEFVDKWLNQMNFSMEIVLEACDITIMNLGKPNFRYTDKILKTWKESNITTKEQIAANEAQFKNAPKPVKATKKTSKFANYAQNSIDYELLERVELKLLKNSLKEGGA